MYCFNVCLEVIMVYFIRLNAESIKPLKYMFILKNKEIFIFDLFLNIYF